MIRSLARIAVAALVLAVACASEEEPSAPSPAATRAPDTATAWTTGAQLPTPRTEVAVAALESRIYVAGGFLPDGGATDVVEVYDTNADDWERSVPLPAALHHTGLAAAGGRLYVVGGYTADKRGSDRVWSWAPGEEAWREEKPLPTARGALAVTTVEVADTVSIHAVGGASTMGSNAALRDAHEALNLESGEWQTLAPLPGPRDHLAAASTEGKLFVVGGRELSLQRNQSRLDVFDPLEGRWTRAPDMPTARGGLAAVARGSRLYVFGGEQPSGTFEAAEVFDVASGEWSAGEPLPSPRHGLGASVVGDRIFVIGGGPTPGLSVSGANEILDAGG